MNLNVLIIGGSGSLGNAIIEKLLSEGYKVGASFYQNKINIQNDRLTTRQINVRDPDSVKRGLEYFIKKMGKIDIYIYNSGICADAEFIDMPSKKWFEVIDVNLNGAFLTTSIIANHMRDNKEGRIIFISSSRGILGSERQSNYAASKAGLIGLAKTLSKELGKHNITSNAICPGFMVTNLNKGSITKKQSALNASVLREYFTVNEVAHFILFMTMPATRKISGQVFNIDNRLN